MPQDILRENYYYTTDTDDFDGEIIRPLENRLAPLSRRLAAAPDQQLSEDESGALRDWCALSISRSSYLAQVAHIARDTLSEEDKGDLPADGKAMVLTARRHIYESLRRRMRGMAMVYRFLKAPHSHSYYLTDQPACTIPSDRVNGVGPLLLPLAHNLMLIQVPEQLAERFFLSFDRSLEITTLVQCGWANRLIYSANLESLHLAINVLQRGEPPDLQTMRKRARLPYFGFGERSTLLALWVSAADPESEP